MPGRTGIGGVLLTGRYCVGQTGGQHPLGPGRQPRGSYELAFLAEAFGIQRRSHHLTSDIVLLGRNLNGETSNGTR